MTVAYALGPDKDLVYSASLWYEVIIFLPTNVATDVKRCPAIVDVSLLI